MPLTEQQQIEVKKFFLTLLKEAISKQNIKQSVITEPEVEDFKTQTELCTLDAKIILNAYQQASNSTQVFANREQLNFNETKIFLQTYTTNELTPAFKRALQENKSSSTERTPLTTSNASNAKFNIILNTIKQLESQLPNDDFYEKYKAEIEQAKKALVTTGMVIGVAALLGLATYGIYAGIKALGGDNNSEPSQAPSFHG